MGAKSDTLPDSVEGCDHELKHCAVALPELSPRSRPHMLARCDKLLDRRLLLTCGAEARREGAAAAGLPASGAPL